MSEITELEAKIVADSSDISEEIMRMNEMLFSLEWMVFTSVGNVVVTSIFYWMDIINDFINDYSRNVTIMVKGLGPFQVFYSILKQN